MQEPKNALPAADAGEFELGMLLGSRNAFASVAGRCSAADAECLRQVREKKLYLTRASTWEEFCPKHLGLSKTHANRIIRNLEEFGPDYFEVAQLTRITPEQFRAIAPAVRDRKIHIDGQAIALIPENTGQVAAAVAELRQTRDPAPTPSPSTQDRISALSRRIDRLAADLKDISRSTDSLAERSLVNSIILQALRPLQRLDLELS